MPTIIIHLVAATACWAGQCHPALVGRPGYRTPTGTYEAVIAHTNSPGYDHRVLGVTRIPGRGVISIHKTWTLIPSERRKWRIRHGNARQRHISMGCINLRPDLFWSMVDKSTVWKVVIEK